MSKAINEAGKTYGRLTVLSRSDNGERGGAKWLCQCSCGKRVDVIGSSLRQGFTKSCGCYHAEIVRRDNFKRCPAKAIEHYMDRFEERMDYNDEEY